MVCVFWKKEPRSARLSLSDKKKPVGPGIRRGIPPFARGISLLHVFKSLKKFWNKRAVTKEGGTGSKKGFFPFLFIQFSCLVSRFIFTLEKYRSSRID